MVERAMIWPPIAPWMAILNKLPGDLLLEPLAYLQRPLARPVPVDHHGQGINFFTVHQDVQLYEIALPVADNS